MTDNFDPFVNLVVEPGEREFIAVQRALGRGDHKRLILPTKQEIGTNAIRKPKMPWDVQLYVGMLTVAGLYIVFRFTRK